MLALFFTYVVLIILSIGVFFASRNLPGKEYGAASPGFFPQVLVISLFVFSICGIIELWRERQREGIGKIRIHRKVLVAMGISLAYIPTMDLIGYFPSTFIFVFAIMFLVRGGSLRISYLMLNSLVLTGLTFVLFKLMLNAYLPKGILF